MKIAFSIFKFELLKIFSDKKLLVLVILSVVLFFGFNAISFASEGALRDEDAYTLGKMDREAELSFYVIAKQNAITDYNNAKSQQYRDEMLKKVRLYDYYLTTQTIEYDYLMIGDPDAKINNHYGVGLMFRFHEYGQLLLMGIAILSVLLVFVFDYESKTFKNMLAAPIDRKQVFIGKLTAAALLQFILFVFVVAVCVACGLFNASDKFLVYSDGVWHARYCLTIFLSQALGNAVIMLFLSALTLILGVISRRAAFSGVGAVALFGIVFTISALFDGTKDAKIVDKYSPIINIIDRCRGGFTVTYIFMLIIHIAVSVLLALQAYAIFKKQDL